MFLSMTTK